MTFSCAEYHWPDIKRLIRERIFLSGKNIPDDFESNYVKYVNTYAIVVQEYFQLRINIWLETVGKSVFKIKHHWLRYEFAASRGQIHAHMLAICDIDKIELLLDCENYEDKISRTEIISQWAEKCFAMTACLDSQHESLPIDDKHPSSIKYSDMKDNPLIDRIKCQKCLQMHICSNYCLKVKK